MELSEVKREPRTCFVIIIFVQFISFMHELNVVNVRVVQNGNGSSYVPLPRTEILS